MIMKKYETYILNKDSIYIDERNMDDYADILKNYKFKIGDYIKIFNSIFKISAIKTDDSTQPYYITGLNSTNGIGYWINDENCEIVPEHELDAIKYNI